MPTPLPRDAAAVRADRRTLLLAAGTLMTVFAVGAAAQTAWVYGNQGGTVPVGTRILANLTAVASMLLILAVTGVSLPQRGTLPLVVGVLSAGITASGVRFAFQLLLDVYVDPSRQVISTELASGACAPRSRSGPRRGCRSSWRSRRCSTRRCGSAARWRRGCTAACSSGSSWSSPAWTG
jgi:hypothetical protein